MAEGASAALDKVEALLRAAEGRGLRELEYAEGGMQLRIAFEAGAAGAAAREASPTALPGISPLEGGEERSATSGPDAIEMVSGGMNARGHAEGRMRGRAEGGNLDRAKTLRAAQAADGAIVSPGVGFLRRSHAGGRFPGEGDEVAAGAVLAFIQAGPLLQPVTASRGGRLGPLLVAEGAGVGFGTALFEFA